ncbi:MAG: thioredoxin-like domain-containing protein [Bacteroidales bacterium]|nr:thioredoxin-like domain-containing protein [Bacteroidales bacterium]
MKRFLFTLLIAIFTIGVFAQNYEIKVKINGISDTVIYLGHHFGEKKYVVDTTVIDSKGNAIFRGEKKLNKGIYLIVMPSKNMNYFEFLIADKTSFSIETDTAGFVEHMKIKGSKENLVFNEYQNKMSDIQEKRMKLNKEYEKAKGNEVEAKIVADKIQALNEERIAYMDKIANTNPNAFFSKILLAMKDIEIPEPPRNEAGVITDSSFQYKYFKSHYFDYVDFAESGLLRTPIFEGKLNYYFDKMVVPLVDSLLPEANNIITKAYEGGDSLMFQFTVSHLLHYFESSKIMGYDAVFVDIAEKWYLSGLATWADSTFLTKLAERVEKVTPTKLGAIAYNLERMQGTDDKYYNLHDIKGDYIALVFYEPHCGHCKTEVPKLMKYYRDSLKELNVKIFAVYTQYDKDEWEEFIDAKNLTEDGWYNVWDGPYPHSKFRDFYDIYSTPVIYVLDKDKKIIGKRIGVENIKSLIEFTKEKERREQKK